MFSKCVPIIQLLQNACDGIASGGTRCKRHGTSFAVSVSCIVQPHFFEPRLLRRAVGAEFFLGAQVVAVEQAAVLAEAARRPACRAGWSSRRRSSGTAPASRTRGAFAGRPAGSRCCTSRTRRANGRPRPGRCGGSRPTGGPGGAACRGRARSRSRPRRGAARGTGPRRGSPGTKAAASSSPAASRRATSAATSAIVRAVSRGPATVTAPGSASASRCHAPANDASGRLPSSTTNRGDTLRRQGEQRVASTPSADSSSLPTTSRLLPAWRPKVT